MDGGSGIVATGMAFILSGGSCSSSSSSSSSSSGISKRRKSINGVLV